jgi:hypothetical protein
MQRPTGVFRLSAGRLGTRNSEYSPGLPVLRRGSSMSDVETLVTEEMRARQGVWKDGQVSYPVGASDIRKWAIAVYWPVVPPRIFWDEEYAKGTVWGGIVAPEEFNPFAWPVEDRTGNEAPGALPGQAVGPGQNFMNGGTKDTFLVRIRPGDVIRSRSKLSHWEERVTRLGLTLFSFNETEWRNQRDEVVRIRIGTQIQY